MSLPRLSIGRPIAVAMVTLAVAMLGVISLFRLPIDLLPDIAYPRLVVYTNQIGVAPSEMERFVSEPIERAVSAVPGVQRVESVSREGSSVVTMRFAWGTDMNFAALNVREKLDNLRGVLPERADRPVLLHTDPTAEPVMALSLSGQGDLWSLESLAESVIKRRLEQIDGVAQATINGGLEREIHVEVDPVELDSHGLTIPDIASALDAANQNATGGTVLRGRSRYSLRTLGEFSSVEDISEVPVERAAGAGTGTIYGQLQSGSSGRASSVRLGDIAQVVDGFRERESMSRYNGRPAIGILVFKEAGANTVRVTELVNDALKELRARYPDIALDVATSQAGFIRDAIDNVIQEAVLGGILAFLVLFLFLRDWRYPVAIALAMPVSIIATFALFDAAGVSLNILSLGGLALGIGLLMDNSIVVVENIFRHREARTAPAQAAAVGTEEVQRAIVASTFTTVAVFGPVIYVHGVAGKLFTPLSLAVVFGLSASVLVAITILPALAARWEDVPSERKRSTGRVRRAFAVIVEPALASFDRGFSRCLAGYERALLWALHHRWQVIAGAFATLVLMAITAGRLDRSVLPQVDQGTFRVHLTLPLGTPFVRTRDAVSELEDVLQSDSSVDAVFTRLGRQQTAAGNLGESEALGVNAAVIDVRLRPGSRTADVMTRLRPKLAAVSPGTVTLTTGQATELGQLLGGGEADLAVQIRGADTDSAMAYGAKLVARLRAVSSLSNVRLATIAGHPELRVEIDRERAAAYGIEPRLVVQTIDAYMRGTVATELVDFDRKVPIIVRLPDRWRNSVQSLGLLRVHGVPLKELVKTRVGIGAGEITRVDQSRVVSVYADIARGGVNDAVSSIDSVLRTVPATSGLHVTIGGESEELQRSFHALTFAFIVALLLVYMILAAEFESLLHPFIVLLSVPLGLVGAVYALWLTGSGLNTVSLIGMVVLVGIVDNDAVVKVDFINQMRARGMGIRDAVVAAGHARVRPILINTITAMLGLLPMALGIGAGGALQAPLAVSLLGGLFSATLLTLIVIPVAYEVAEEVKAQFGRAMSGRRMTPRVGSVGDATIGISGAEVHIGVQPTVREGSLRQS